MLKHIIYALIVLLSRPVRAQEPIVKEPQESVQVAQEPAMPAYEEREQIVTYADGVYREKTYTRRIKLDKVAIEREQADAEVRKVAEEAAQVLTTQALQEVTRYEEDHPPDGKGDGKGNEPIKRKIKPIPNPIPKPH